MTNLYESKFIESVRNGITKSFLSRFLNKSEDNQFLMTTIVKELLIPDSQFYFLSEREEELIKKAEDEIMTDGDLSLKTCRSLLYSEFGISFMKDRLFVHYSKSFLQNIKLEDNMIRVFRSIKTNYDFIHSVKHKKVIYLGECWAADYKDAKPYYAKVDMKNEYIFLAKVKFTDIDIFLSILLNIVNDENEIRVKHNVALHSLKIEKKGDFFTYELHPDIHISSVSKKYF